MQHTIGVPVDSYKTGHTPKMSYNKLIAHVNARSAFLEDLSTSHDRSNSRPAAKPSKSARRVLKLVITYDIDVTCLRELVSRERAPVLVRGVLFGVKRTRAGWSMLSIEGRERTLNADCTACSCEDNRFRNRPCKHMEAMKCFCRQS